VPIRAVLFDAAGTLMHPAQPVGQTYSRALAEQGADVPAWRLDDAFARIMRRAEPCVFPGAGAEEIPERERQWWWWRVRESVRAADSQVKVRDFDAMFAGLWAHFANASAWEVTEGALETLDLLRKRGLRLAIVSNFDSRLEPLLHGLGLASRFEAVLRPAHVGAAKPDARIFHAALERLSVAPDEAVHVGDDSQEDLAGARAAGLLAVDPGELATLRDLPNRLAELE
jgi:putative hydrolase of the HAD superfamily